MRSVSWIPWLVVLAACSGSDGRPETAPSVTSAPGTTAAVVAPTSGREALEPVVAPLHVQEARWARGSVPRRVPDPDEALPSLLDDPPGRAVVASYVPRVTSGWAGEAIEFYGEDARWRRLSLGDLSLPEAGWDGNDTYGAGALSPDGRWWAGSMLSGFFVLDLRDSSVRVGAPPAGHRYGDAGMPTFSWSPDSDELVVTTRSRADRVSLATLRRQPFPCPRVTPYLLRDGGWVQCPRGARGVASCTTYSEDGTVTADRGVPADLQGRLTSLIDQHDGSFGFSMPTTSSGNARSDWDVVLADRDFRARSVLTLPRGSEIDGLGDVLGPTTLGLIAYDERQLLAFLSDSGEIVRLLRTRKLNDEYDYWDVSFARDVMDVDGRGTARRP